MKSGKTVSPPLIANDEDVDVTQDQEAILKHAIGVAYFELGLYEKAIEEAKDVVGLLEGNVISFENRNTTLNATFVLLGNCHYMQYVRKSFDDYELFDWSDRFYNTAILPYVDPEHREILIPDSDATILGLTLENGIEMSVPAVSFLHPEVLLQDLTDEEKGVIVLAYVNLSQLYLDINTDVNGAQLLAKYAIGVGNELPINSKESVLYAYGNYFKAILASSQTLESQNYIEEISYWRDEAESNTSAARTLAAELNWIGPAYASTMFYAGQYFSLIGEKEKGLELMAESVFVYIQCGEINVAQIFLPIVKQAYRELYPIKTLFGGFDRWLKTNLNEKLQ
jgi:tetratricopeptide (TPR) repeat protein